MSFSHYWGGLFCSICNNVARFAEVWGHLCALPQCFSQVGDTDISTHQIVSFSDIPVAQQEFSSRKKQQGCALFLNVFWLRVLLISVCARPISTLRHNSRSGCCVAPRCSFGNDGNDSNYGAISFFLLHLEQSVEMEVITSFLQVQGVQVFLQNASCHVLQVQNLKLKDHQA